MGLTQITTGGVDDNINIDSNTLKVDGTNNRVGIGTASPNTLLDCAGGNITLTEDTNLIFKNSARDTNRGAIQFTSGGEFRVRYGSLLSEALRIDSSGRVGVGDSNPNFTLDVNGNVGIREDNNLTFHDGAGVAAFRIRGTSDNKLFFERASGNEHQMVIDDGNVGIGTTTITNPYSQSNFTNVNIDGTWGGIISFKLGGVEQGWIGQRSSGNQEMILGASSGKNLLFATNGNNERMRIDTSGRLLIGVSSSYANANADDLQVGNNNSSTESGITLGSTAESTIRFADAGNAGAGIIAYTHSSDSMRFYTSATERMRIDSAGRVGIGTTSPGYPLEIRSSSSDGNFVVGNSSGQALQGGYSTGGAASYIQAWNTVASAFIDLNIYGSTVKFGTGSGATERVRIDSSGRLLVGTSSPSLGSRFVVSKSGTDVAGFENTSGTAGEVILTLKGGPNSSDSTTKYASFQTLNGTERGKILATGTNSVVYSTSSDYRLKENVVDLDGAITRVKQLAPKRFNFIADNTATVDGFIAHEAQTVVPEAVTGTHNEVDADGNAVMQGIDQSKLVPLLTAALQEAIAKIETLETKVAALEAAE